MSKIQPDRVADQFRGKATADAGILGQVRHGRPIADPRRSGNPARDQLDGAPAHDL